MTQLELINRTSRLEALKKALDKYGHAVDPLLRLSVEYLIECASDTPKAIVIANKSTQISKPPSHFIKIQRFIDKHGFASATLYKNIYNFCETRRSDFWIKYAGKVWVHEEKLLEVLATSDNARISSRAKRCLALLRKEAAHDKA